MLDTTNPCNGYKETTVSSDSGGGSSLDLSLPGFPLPGNTKIPPNLMSLCVKYCQDKFDWRWLAALAWAECSWNVNAKNTIAPSRIGYFQYQGGTSDQQAKNAANDFKAAMDTAKSKGLTDTVDQCLYAAVSHNAGSGGAAWALRNANPKTINGINHVMLNGDGKWGGYGEYFGNNDIDHPLYLRLHGKPEMQRSQSKEKSQYSIKVKKAYDDICKHYGNNI